MLREIGETLLGVSLAVLGIFLLYLFFTSLNNKTNYLFLLLSFVFLGGAVFLFIHAEKSDTVILKRVKPEESGILTETSKKAGLTSKIQKNNEMIAEWNKTNETRDKMKMIEMSAQPK